MATVPTHVQELQATLNRMSHQHLLEVPPSAPRPPLDAGAGITPEQVAEGAFWQARLLLGHFPLSHCYCYWSQVGCAMSKQPAPQLILASIAAAKQFPLTALLCWTMPGWTDCCSFLSPFPRCCARWVHNVTPFTRTPHSRNNKIRNILCYLIPFPWRFAWHPSWTPFTPSSRPGHGLFLQQPSLDHCTVLCYGVAVDSLPWLPHLLAGWQLGGRFIPIWELSYLSMAVKALRAS